MEATNKLLNVLDEMVINQWMVTRIGDNYLLDSGEQLDNKHIRTPKTYKVPIRIEAIAMTDSSNIRLSYGKAQLIFNWERNYDFLRATEPAKGKICHVLGGGRVPVGEWVSFTWIIESSYMKVIVNGEERVHVDGKFHRVTGQPGIGPAFRSKVTVKSFKVAGEETEPKPEKPKPLQYEFDECHIAVPLDRHNEAVDWYCRHLRMYVQDNSSISPIHPDLKGTLLEFKDGKGSIGLVSGSEQHEHFHVDWGRMDGFRYSVSTGHLQATRHSLIERGIRTSSILCGKNGFDRFDFLDPYGTRLTVVRDLKLDPSIAGIIGFSLPTLAVTDLIKSREWYHKHLQLRRDSKHSTPEADLLVGLWRFNGVPEGVLWLEKLEWFNKPDTRVDSATRMYFFVEPRCFVQSHNRLKNNGVTVSDISGSAFHLYDPDGNRINIFTC